jgi:hypothetical protein
MNSSMNRIASLGSVFALAMALETGVHAEEKLHMDAAITAPADGAWYDSGDEFTLEGWSVYEDVDIRVFNLEHEAWESRWQVQGSDDGYINPYGNRAYSWSIPDIFVSFAGNPAYLGRGATRETGQRSNALYYSIEGWGSTSELDHTYYTTIYISCGGAAQDCCQDSEDACDGDLRCSRNTCRP